ncbi:unnamed protein product [Lactuca virosa]|uniref:Uncharacterized protein n=1 Tax=Lactuca virosa TaxID=75947 RepID=A0AAU9MBT9_9ASTR|nr:unnamed protein product [Lactuca virosa]
MSSSVLTSAHIPDQTDHENFDDIIQERIINLTESQSQSPIIHPISQPFANTTLLMQTIHTTLIFHESTTPVQTIIVNTEEHHYEDNDEFFVQEYDLETIAVFQSFVEPVLAASLLDDESDLDDETAIAPASRRYYQMLNRKLNAFIRRTDSFSPTNF